MKGVLLVNLGTPDSPSVADVRKYLREFLMDGRVIDIPLLPRWLLVNLIIAPFRSPKSAKTYQKVWTKQGSPLKVYGYEVKELLQKALGNMYQVELGMRYQSPSIAQALESLKKNHVTEIIVVPLFPQYASATTGSVQQKVMELVSNWQLIPKMTFIDAFFDNPSFINTFVTIAQNYIASRHYDHYVFTYHGLPERQIRKGDNTGNCLSGNCCNTLHAGNRLCYRAQCFATTRLLAEKLNISTENYTVCFQSRLGKDVWIQPYTEDVVKELAKAGKKSVLAFSPSFVADCLETTIEVGEEYKEMFEKAGGEHWQLVESLNNHPLWIETLQEMINNNSGKL